MLRIRLSRVGKKKQPSYRIVVADSRAPREGSFLEIIGHYNPLTDPATVVVKEEKAVHWLQQGARPSDTAAKLLSRVGVMEKAGLDPVVHQPRSKPPRKKAEAAVPAAPQAAAPAEPEPAPAPEPEAAPAPEPEAEQPEAEAPEQPEPTE